MCRKVNRWLQDKVRSWLGLKHRTFIGVDFGVRSPTVIIVATKLRGGFVRFIEIPGGNFEEVQQLVDMLETSFSPINVFWDLPAGFNREYR